MNDAKIMYEVREDIGYVTINTPKIPERLNKESSRSHSRGPVDYGRRISMRASSLPAQEKSL